MSNRSKSCAPLNAGLSLLLFCLIFFHFEPLLKFPFVLDDWVHIHEFMMRPHTTQWFLESLSPQGHFFRPLWFVSLFGLHKLFGLNYAAFHGIFIFCHFLNCLLIVRILTGLGTGRWTAWAAAFLYASAPGVHEMTILWPTATHMVGGWLFFLISFKRYLKGRMKSAAFFYFISLLFKEGTFFLPALFMLHRLQTDQSGVRSKTAGLAAFWPFAVVMGVYFALRVPGLSTLHFNGQSTYQMSLIEIFKNTFWYGTLSCESIFFFKSIPFVKSVMLPANAALALFLTAGFYVRRKTNTATERTFLFFGAWYVLGLLPVLAIRYIRSDFWLTYSLPAVIVLFLVSAESLGERAWGRRTTRLLIALFIAANTAFAHADLVRREHLALSGGHSQRVDLMFTGATVKTVWEGLASQLPQLPAYSTLLFAGIDVWPFGRHLGPRVWYRDDTIQAYNFDYLKIGPTGPAIENHPVDFLHFIHGKTLDPVKLDPDKTLVVSVCGPKMRVYKLTDIVDTSGRMIFKSLDEYTYGAAIRPDCADYAFFSNFGAREGDFRWTEAKNAEIYLRLGTDVDTGGRYELEIESGALKNQRTDISINGQAVGSLTFEGFSTQTGRLVFPGSALKGSGINSIEFDIPGARSEAPDKRLLGLAFRSLKIRPLP